jgi:hypothetical protein
MDSHESELSVKAEGMEEGKGGSILDKLINVTPLEIHLPGYQFLGPGTHLEERLQRGERGINPLDNACLQHDIAYSSQNTDNRTKADRKLAERAFSRMLSETSDRDEKIAATITVFCMVGKILWDNIFRRVKSALKFLRKRKRRPVVRRQSDGQDS